MKGQVEELCLTMLVKSEENGDGRTESYISTSPPPRDDWKEEAPLTKGFH